MNTRKQIAVLLLAAVFSLTACAGAAPSSGAAPAAPKEPEPVSAASGSGEAPESGSEGEGLAPVYASQLREGSYDIKVHSNASMFRVTAAKLIVEGDSMHCVMTLSGVGYGKLFMGTKEEARKADESETIPFVKDAEGYYTYDCPIEALDKETDCAAWSIKNKRWYPRVLIYQSDSLPPEAWKTAP